MAGSALTGPGPGPGDRAPDPPLLSTAGTELALSWFWQDRPAVVVFLRYFGCPFCQAQVVGLREDRQRFDEAGASVLLVGQGSPEEAAAFGERRRVPFPTLIDPDRNAYRAYGLYNGRLSQVMGPAVAGPFLRVNVHRETRQGPLHGGAFMQMPGTFVVDASGILRLCHRNLTVADSPANDLLLEVVRATVRDEAAGPPIPGLRLPEAGTNPPDRPR